MPRDLTATLPLLQWQPGGGREDDRGGIARRRRQNDEDGWAFSSQNSTKIVVADWQRLTVVEDAKLEGEKEEIREANKERRKGGGGVAENGRMKKKENI
ncbi:unnamed protein product [Cuscuta epithymum]|uniref:Uncharacterized protein n=1 Tax=Cuscuta epithymum TaxID=186058 RepID=A0AAV0CZJ7_9ASTE|nr:unnamed protein product [Cuscuta epithymum]